jgi:SAM-dependent methyltransferase
MQVGRFRDEKRGVAKYFRSRDLRGKVVVDIPAGIGRMTRILREQGAEVKALDLFTHGRVVADVTIAKADLMGPLPLSSGSADYVLCQEGIEHLPDQMTCLKEFHRVLKKEGILILTTPNCSNLRARFYNFFLGSHSPRHLPANEVDDVWFGEGEEVSFGHIFLIGIQRLRVLARVAGFKIKKVHPTKLSGTSLLLFVLSYPFLVGLSLLAYCRSLRRRKDELHTGQEAKRRVLREIMALNLSPLVLLSNHLFVEFEKSPTDRHRLV